MGDTTKNALLDISQILNRSITNIVPLAQPETKEILHPPPNVRQTHRVLPPQLNLFPKILPNKVHLPRVQKETENSLLSRVQREHPPGVRRSPRNHENSMLQLPTRATYCIPLPKQSKPKLCPARTSDQILEAVINKLQPNLGLNSNSVKQQALNQLLTWEQQAFNAFLQG